MFDVSRREPRQLGSAGKFVDPDTGESIGVVRSVRCNADGGRNHLSWKWGRGEGSRGAVLALVLGTSACDSMTRGEVLEALEETRDSARGEQATQEPIEISTEFTIGDAVWVRQVAANPFADVDAIWSRIEAALAKGTGA